jgi:formylglycine-generating enzyme required for sulfatase activity
MFSERILASGSVVIVILSTLTLAATPTPGPNVTPAVGDTRTRPADDMEMVYVPSGEFQMGSNDGNSDERPVHTVALSGFWMDKTEVTNAQHGKCVAAGACDASGYADDAGFGDATRPVVGVNWSDARDYCDWAGVRLPAEAEWEYAARGPEGPIYPWGNEFDGTKLNFCDQNCEYKQADESADDGYAKAAPVGSYPDGASWIGALDMAGNVWEWVADWYDEDFYERSSQLNPSGPESGSSRVLRGGSWFYSPLYVRGSFRLDWFPVFRSDHSGFRCAMSSE